MRLKDRIGRDELFYDIADGKYADAIAEIETTEDINYKDKNGYSYLHIAAQCNAVSVVEKLIEKGIETDAADKYGKTPLMVAVIGYSDDRSVIDLLLKNGADPCAKANSGMSVRELAKMNGLEI